MVEDSINKFKYSFPAYSALYHLIDGMIFTRYDFAYKVIKILPDENDRNKKIMNPKRLKERLFRTIMVLYNQRIDKYNLLFDKLSPNQKGNLEIKKYKLVSSMEDEDEYSGRHMIYPRTFVCKKCGDLRMIKKDEWSTFNPKKCQVSGCEGEYEQVSIMMFCSQCGNIVPFYYYCEKNHLIRLERKEKDALASWKVRCITCNKEGIDPFRFPCKHKDKTGNIICKEEATKFKPLTIKEGGIFTPVVITSIDIPPTENVELKDLEYLLLGLYLNKFNKISEKIKCDINLSKIESFLRTYKDQNIKNMMFTTDPSLSELSSEEKEEEWKKKWFIDIIEKEVENLKDDYANVNLENLNDYFAIKGAFSDEEADIMPYDKYLESINDATRKKMLKVSFDSFKKSFGIKNITYISNINLISSCVGLICGINKFYEPGFVPHFNPIWKDDRKKEKMISYSYPFETEGILIELDRKKVCNWLIDNEILMGMEKPTTESEATEILLKIRHKTPEYNALKTLIHTLSHVLIKRSSLHTGLDSDSCSELLFVNNAAVLIYATSNINIGGFAFVFEHSLMDWFREIKLEISECTFDPTCIFENGACFSCLYLPEYVCSEFNKDLDRDVFMGSKRYSTPYW